MPETSYDQDLQTVHSIHQASHRSRTTSDFRPSKDTNTVTLFVPKHQCENLRQCLARRHQHAPFTTSLHFTSLPLLSVVISDHSRCTSGTFSTYATTINTRFYPRRTLSNSQQLFLPPTSLSPHAYACGNMLPPRPATPEEPMPKVYYDPSLGKDSVVDVG